MFTTGLAVSISDNDQVKAAGKDYVNVKCETSVTSVRMYCDNVTKSRKHKVCLRYFRILLILIYLYLSICLSI